MKKLSPALTRASQLLLAAGLLATSPAMAQTTAQVYTLLNQVPYGTSSVQPAAQGINTLNISYGPSAAGPTTVTGTRFVTSSPKPLTGLTGLTAAQVIVAIDTRPNTGVLYALGYDPTIAYDATQATKNAQLYTLLPATGALTAVGTGFSINVQDTNNGTGNTGSMGYTRGFLPNVGFDFNPRVDRIRIVTPGRGDYRVNPNTGALVATDGTLTYANSTQTPYVGTASYTNSVPGLAGTTLYDLDITAGAAAKVAIQNPPNNGTLVSQAQLTFQVNNDPDYSQLASPTIAIDLDILYQNGQNVPLLLEARYSDLSNSDQTQGYASNLYVLNTSNGQAKGNNLFGKSNTYISNIAAVTGPQKVWNGTLSTDWQTAGNWTPSGVPTATDNVVIPGPGGTVMYQPTLTGVGTTNSLVLIAGVNNSMSVLTLADGSNLQVSGDFVNNDGALRGSNGSYGTGVVTLVGGTTQDIAGANPTIFPNLAVNSGTAATVSATESVTGALTVTNSTLTVNAGQTFTLLSTATGTAYVVNANGGKVNGTVTVQRYINPSLNGGPGYRHYSTPITANGTPTTGGTVADFATSGYSPTVNATYNSSSNPRAVQPYPTVFTYDQSRLATSNASYAVGDFDNGFLSPSALTDQLAVATGYTVNIDGSQLVDFAGTLNDGPYTKDNLARGAQVAAGYQFLGNPYPGAIDFNMVLSSSSGMESALYVYKSSGQYSGSYTTYVNGLGTSTGTNNIPLAQGFFMRTAAGQTGTVRFTNAARTNTTEMAQFQRTTATTLPTLALTLRDAASANQMRVYFEQGATPAFDAAFDAHYLPATTGLDLASELPTEALAINGLPALTGAAVTVPLRLHAATAGTYTLAVDELLNLPTGYRAYLLDASTGLSTDLTTTPSLTLALDPADATAGRYALVFGTAAPLAAAPAALASLVALYPNPAHGTAVLVLPTTLRGPAASEVQVLNALGQVVLRRSVAAGGSDQVALPLENLAAGVYTVRASTTSGTVARQLVVE